MMNLESIHTCMLNLVEFHDFKHGSCYLCLNGGLYHTCIYELCCFGTQFHIFEALKRNLKFNHTCMKF